MGLAIGESDYESEDTGLCAGDTTDVQQSPQAWSGHCG